LLAEANLRQMPYNGLMDTRNCANCKKDFTIEPEDFNFYEKISVPPPKLCRECRQMRRMSFRNERTLYKRKCDKTDQDIVSVFSPDSPHKVYNVALWNSDQFNPMTYGRDFDFSRPFFEQFREFMLEIPFASLRVTSSENCEYNNDMSQSKDCYLCARTHQSTNMLYTYRGNVSRDCVDCMQVVKGSEFLYECIECIACNNSSYLYFSENCSRSSMLWNCKNCLDCFMCSNLRNKQYCFKNIQLSREEYMKKIAEFSLSSFSKKEEALREFADFNNQNIKKYLNITNSKNSSGDNITNCRNSHMCFGVKFTENVRYLWDVMKYKDSMDSYSGGRDSQLIYDCTATAGAYNCRFCVRASDAQDVQYSMFVKNSHDIFGCIGLKNKEFCIFNKQYSESEYHELLKRIVEHMRKTGEYGEFFPAALSMFAYNETVAQEYFPLSKEEAKKKGLRWQEPSDRDYVPTTNPEELEDDLNNTPDDILKEVIGCAHKGECLEGCTTAFRIIPRELEFYRKMNLPIPRLCPNCRHYGRLQKLNPQKLWTRSCQCAGQESEKGVYKNLAPHSLHGENPCPNEFETSYAPDRPDIIYCETCYQQEVY
jgi:predicted small metal-binding protein